MAAACAELLKRERGAWQLLRLDRIDADSAWPQALWVAGAEGSIAPARPRRTDVLPFIRFDEDGYEGYLAGRSRNFRSQLGRRRRKLERDHGLAFRMTTGAERLDADFETFFRLHEERWKGRGGSSSGTEEVKRFPPRVRRGGAGAGLAAAVDGGSRRRSSGRLVRLADRRALLLLALRA